MDLNGYVIPSLCYHQIIDYLGFDSLKLLSLSKQFSELKDEIQIKLAQLIVNRAFEYDAEADDEEEEGEEGEEEGEGMDEEGKEEVGKTQRVKKTKTKSINWYLRRYISVYDSIQDFGNYHGCGKFLEVLFSAVVRDDPVTLRICLEHPSLPQNPSYKFNFSTYPGFATYFDEATDDESHAGISILQLAALLNSSKAAQVILEMKAGGETARNSTCIWGTSATHIAAWNHSINTLELLLSHGGRANSKNMDQYSWQSWCGSDMNITPLHAALLGPFSRDDYTEETQKNTVECLKLLIQYGARVNNVTGPVSASEPKGPQEDAVYGEGNQGRACSLCPLHLAVLCRNKAALVLLLENEAHEQRMGQEGVLSYLPTQPLSEGEETLDEEGEDADNYEGLVCVGDGVGDHLEVICDLIDDEIDDYDEDDLTLPIVDVETGTDAPVDADADADSEEKDEISINEAEESESKSEFELHTEDFESDYEEMKAFREKDVGKTVVSGNDLQLCFSDLKEVNFIHRVPYRRLFYPRTLAIAQAAYLSKREEDYGISLDLAHILSNYSRETKRELATLPLNDPTCEEIETDDLMTPSQILSSVASILSTVEPAVESVELAEEELNFPKEAQEFGQLILSPYETSLREELDGTFQRLKFTFQEEFKYENELRLEIFYSLLRMIEIPVQKLSHSLISFCSERTGTGTRLSRENISKALENVLPHESPFFEILIEKLDPMESMPQRENEREGVRAGERRENECLFSLSSTRCYLSSIDQNIPIDFPEYLLLITSQFIQSLLWILLHEAMLSRSQLLSGNYLSQKLCLSESLTDQSPRHLAEYLWLYLETISNSNELMELFFSSSEGVDSLSVFDSVPVSDVSASAVCHEDVWELARYLRRNDQQFIQFLLSCLIDRNQIDYIDCDDLSRLVSCLYDLQLHRHECFDVKKSSRIMQSLLKMLLFNEEDLDDCHEETALSLSKPSSLLRERLRQLHWHLDEKTRLSLDQELVSVYRLVGDAHQYLRSFSNALQSYQQSLQILFPEREEEGERDREIEPPKKRQRQDGDGDGDGDGERGGTLSCSSYDILKVSSEFHSDCVGCFLGIAECYAAMNQIERSFDYFCLYFEALEKRSLYRRRSISDTLRRFHDWVYGP